MKCYICGTPLHLPLRLLVIQEKQIFLCDVCMSLYENRDDEALDERAKRADKHK